MCEVDPYFGHMVRRRLAELRKHLFRFLDAPRLKEHCGRPIGRKHVVGLAVEHVGVTVEGPGEILYIYIYEYIYIYIYITLDLLELVLGLVLLVLASVLVKP
jgi:hypothetical protein